MAFKTIDQAVSEALGTGDWIIVSKQKSIVSPDGLRKKDKYQPGTPSEEDRANNGDSYDHVARGWWEYGCAGSVWFGTGEPVEPNWFPTRADAQSAVERNEKFYLVRRWVSPGEWERLDEEVANDD